VGQPGADCAKSGENHHHQKKKENFVGYFFVFKNMLFSFR
jgi:hypothetical protein